MSLDYMCDPSSKNSFNFNWSPSKPKLPLLLLVLLCNIHVCVYVHICMYVLFDHVFFLFFFIIIIILFLPFFSPPHLPRTYLHIPLVTLTHTWIHTCITHFHTCTETHTSMKYLYVVLPLTKTTKDLHQIQIIVHHCYVLFFYTCVCLICLLSHCTNRKKKRLQLEFKLWIKSSTYWCPERRKMSFQRRFPKGQLITPRGDIEDFQF